MPGGASGAKAAPITGLPYYYGQSVGRYAQSNPGIVVVRIYAI
jgi:hypothetical protein